MKTLIRAIALVATTVLVSTACGGTSQVSADASDSANDLNVVQSETESADETSASEQSPEPSGDPSASGETKTLDEYLGIAAGFVRDGRSGRGAGGGFNNEQFIEEQRLIEQGIQVCMQAQGFEYVPGEFGGGIRVFVGQQDQGTSPEEYAAEQGFGISTGFDAILEGDIDFTIPEDPNTEYLNGLSEGEADAWVLALQGTPPERNASGQFVDPETGEVIQGGRGPLGARGGCGGDAQVKVRGDFSLLGELEDEFEELDSRIAADPRVAQINRDWADCIREAGFAYETEDEARADIQSQFQPLLFSFFGRGPGQRQGQGQVEVEVEAGGGNPFADLQLTLEQEAELAQIQDLEISVAVASLECKGDTDDEVAEITARYEADFVEANRATLEQFAG